MDLSPRVDDLPAPRRRAPHPSRGTRVRRAATAVALLGMLVAGCSGSSDESAATARGDSGADVEAVSDAAGEAATRSVITTASVGVVVGDPVKAASAVSELVDQSGGRVESREETAASQEREAPARADLTVRIPSEKLTTTIASLETLGSVESTSISSSDVTSQVTDVAARIEALEVSVTRLEALMAEAATTADLLEAEATLTQRQAELESLQAQRDDLGDQVAMSTLTISLTTAPVASTTTPAGFWGGLSTGWDALTSTIGAVVVGLGVALPWLALAAVAFGVYRWVRRRVRRPTGTPPAAAAPVPPTA